MIDKRLESEKQTAFEPFSLVAHRINYILPFTYSDRVNKRAYADTKYGDELRKEEAEFQISFKVPMNYDDLLFDGDGLFFWYDAQIVLAGIHGGCVASVS